MANRRKRPAEDTPEEETITTGTEVEDANPVSALLGLESGGEVMVYRSQPKYAKGFCEMMSAGDGGELASMIRKRWGGGRYCLRSKVPQQPGTNKTVWQKGGGRRDRDCRRTADRRPAIREHSDRRARSAGASTQPRTGTDAAAVHSGFPRTPTSPTGCKVPCLVWCSRRSRARKVEGQSKRLTWWS